MKREEGLRPFELVSTRDFWVGNQDTYVISTSCLQVRNVAMIWAFAPWLMLRLKTGLVSGVTPQHQRSLPAVVNLANYSVGWSPLHARRT